MCRLPLRRPSKAMLVLKFAGTVSQHPRLLHIQDIAISHPHPVLNNTRKIIFFRPLQCSSAESPSPASCIFDVRVDGSTGKCSSSTRNRSSRGDTRIIDDSRIPEIEVPTKYHRPWYFRRTFLNRNDYDNDVALLWFSNYNWRMQLLWCVLLLA